MDLGDHKGQSRLNLDGRFHAAYKLMAVFAVWLAIGAWVVAGEEQQNTEKIKPGPAAGQYRQCVDRGINYLQSQGQAPDGSYNERAGVGITALVTTAVLRCGRTP